MMANAQSPKRALRAELRQARRTMPQTQRTLANEKLTANLVALAKQYSAKQVACYLSSEYEPSTRAFLEWCDANNVDVIVPISREDGLLDWIRYRHQDEHITELGIPEIDGDVLGPIAASYVDLIIAPALAVSPSGFRLGQGRGYYDKLLGSTDQAPPTFAVAFANEVFDDLPVDKWDEPLSGYVTQAGINVAD